VEETGGATTTFHVATHELRTPLAVLRLLGANLPAADQLLFEETVDHVEAILAGFGGRAAAAQPASAEDVTDSVVRMLRTLHPERSIERVGSTGAAIDRHPVEEILINIVNNALRHSPADTPVVIRVGGGADHVTLTVEDCGEGIPPAERAAVFTEGYSTARSTGLGLSVSRKLAESRGGRLEVLDCVAGCTIMLTMPVIG